MTKAYYVFQTDENGTILAVNKVIGLDQIEERRTDEAHLKPGKCLIYDPTEARFVEPFTKSA